MSSNAPDERGPKRSMKDMTKAERRELQERQKAEKKAKQAGGGGPTTSSGSPNAGSNNSSGQTGSGFNPHTGSLPTAPSTPHPTTPSSGTPSGSGPSTAKGGNAPHVRIDDSNKKGKVKGGEKLSTVGAPRLEHRPVPLLSHLTQFERENTALAELRSQNQIHPAIINIGLQFSDHIICGGSARCLAMLLAFKKVISDYVTPVGTSLQRHLTSHIGKQIDYLTTTRSLADSMKTAIRQLKNEITKNSIDKADEDVKESLRNWIDDFIKEKITVAASAIIQNCMKKIRDGDVILIYARSSVVEKLLLEAHRCGISFRVIVCDSRPKLEGRIMLERLVSAGIACTYILSNSLGVVIKDVTKLILGASSLLSNGAVMARAGTALVAMIASDANIPVIVLCELYKFSETVRLDSFVWNEIGDPDALVNLENRPPNARLPSTLESLRLQDATSTSQRRTHLLKDWRQFPDLKLLNLHYDVTPATCISMVVCENGFIPSTSVLSVLNNLERENREKK
ncbi:Eukaryotic translation initiation factor 2B, subunit 4 delta, 67kDa [Dinochytrium kinnereticum]|nr:Eukaryotic translation initiation factor 2B, subunit 4 delta, 67kDa [Dinochytrium kinnereticum]